MLNDAKKIGLNGFIYLIAALFSKGLNVLLLPVYANHLSVEQYGIISLLLLFKAIMVSILGIGQVVTIKKTFYEYKQSGNNFKTYFSTVILGTVFCDFLLLLVFLVIGDKFFNVFFEGISFWNIGIFVLLSVTLLIPYQLYLKLCQTRNESIKFSMLEITLMVIESIVSLALIIFWTFGASGKAIGMLVSSVLIIFITLPLIFKEIDFKFDYKVYKKTFLIGLPIIPHSIAGLILNMSDRIFLNKKYNLETVGIYSLAYQISQIIDIISLSFIEAWSTFFMKNAREKGKEETVAKFAIYYITFTATITVFVSIFSKELITLFFDDRYLASYKIIPLVALGYCVKNIYYLSNQQLIIKEKTSLLLYSTGIASILNIVLNYLLINILDWGMFGAAIATIISLVVMSMISYLNGQRVFHIPYKKAVIFTIFIILFFGINSIYVLEYFGWDSLVLKTFLFFFYTGLSLCILVKSEFNDIKSMIFNHVVKKGDF